jgi:hypothetical protein
MCASPHPTASTPMYALFSMQLALLRMREQCLSDISTELAKIKGEVLLMAAKQMTDKNKLGILLRTVDTLLNKVIMSLTMNC